MTLNNDTVAAICYRCDSKYRYFLINSIHSIVRFYKGPKKLIIYICTNEESFKLPEVDKLQEKYDFNYEVVTINKKYFELHNELKPYSHLASRKFCGFRKEFHYSKEQTYNNTTRPVNPFARSKVSQFLATFFMACTDYKNILHIDTDTIVTSNIAELFEINFKDYHIAACRDWVAYNTFSPSVMLVDTEKWKDIFFKKPNGLLSVFTEYNNIPNADDVAFGDRTQQTLNTLVGSSWLEIDKNWNVPLTHVHLYDSPKIYHFSESWSGRPNVINAYEQILSKYVLNE
jgi:lipopolysaccharide biosynthesis glycosyltransferase